MTAELLFKSQKIESKGEALSETFDISKYSELSIGIIYTAINADLIVCAGNGSKKDIIKTIKISSIDNGVQIIPIIPNGEKGQFYSIVIKNTGTVPALLSGMVIGKLRYSK